MNPEMHPEARQWIDKLELQPHPEGGWYRESYRAPTLVPTAAGPRPASTAIYFLLTGQDVSHLHRIASDELWHFYAGAELTIHVLSEAGYQAMPLGREHLSAVVPAGDWFGASLNPGTDYALVGCTVAPGFDFADFEMGSRAQLLEQFPAQQSLIERLTAA